MIDRKVQRFALLDDSIRLSQMRKLFHLTPTQNEESILREGLKPKKLKNPLKATDEGATEGPEPTFPVTYLAISALAAVTFSRNEGDKGRYTIFQVSVPSSVVLHDDPYSYSEGFYITESIASQNVKVVKHGSW